MTTIIRNIEQFNNAKSVEELKSNLAEYIDVYEIGHVVEDRAEADQWFKEISEDGTDQTTHWANCQTAHFTLADDTQVRVKIDEISRDGDCDNYCYIITVEEE